MSAYKLGVSIFRGLFSNAAMDANTAIHKLVDEGLALDALLSAPANLKSPKGFAPRNADAPADWQPDAALLAQPWNRTPEALFENGPEFFNIDRTILGRDYGTTTIYKSWGRYAGLPETGAKGPGTLGVGFDDQGRPLPVSEAVDILFMIQDKNGKVSALLGNRQDTEEPCMIGGFRDKGETRMEAAVREFIEEAVSASYKIPVPQSVIDKRQEAEYKYKELKAKNPQAIEDIREFITSKVSLAYHGLVGADSRVNNDRGVVTNVFTGVIKKEELAERLARHGLNLDEKSEEIGKLKAVPLTAPLLSNMFASHGSFVIYGLAQNIKTGALTYGKALKKQVADILTVRQAAQARLANTANSNNYMPKAQIG